MTKEELIMLETIYKKEQEKRKEIHGLLEDEKITRFLSLTNNGQMVNDLKHQYSLEPEDIFRDILSRITLSGSSDIYFIDQEREDQKGRRRYYANLESYDHEFDKKIFEDDIDEFESTHDVIDEHNPLFQEDGCRIAQTNFFLEAFKNGQSAAKKMILEKYGNKKDQK